MQGAPGLQGEKGDTGAQGSKGDTGTQGLKGDKGDPGMANVQVRTSQGIANKTTDANVTAECLPGEKAVSGGYSAPKTANSFKSFPVVAQGTPKSWNVQASSSNPNGDTVEVYVVCSS